jgi:Pyridoxamine 5'-phosphate oxidase
MNQAEVNAVLADPRSKALLESPLAARLAYAGLDGTPRVVPVGFLWTGAEIVMCTVPSAPKVRALRERPAVAITIDEEDPPQKALLLRGTAAIDVVEGVPEEYIRAAAKRIAGETLSRFEAEVRSLYGEMARVRVRPGWAKLLDFDGGPLPAFLQRLIDARA